MSETLQVVVAEIQKPLPKATGSFLAICALLLICSFAADQRFTGNDHTEAMRSVLPFKRMATVVFGILATLWGVSFWAGSVDKISGQAVLVELVGSFLFYGILMLSIGATASVFGHAFISRRKN